MIFLKDGFEWNDVFPKYYITCMNWDFPVDGIVIATGRLK